MFTDVPKLLNLMHTAESELLLSSEELKDEVYIVPIHLEKVSYPPLEQKLSKAGKQAFLRRKVCLECLQVYFSSRGAKAKLRAR